MIAYARRVGTQTNPDLEARILASVDDRDAYLVYGDWLSERGDPRGELITVQAKLEQDPDNAELREREHKLLDANKETWFGELAKLDPKIDFGVKWRWGFIDSVRLGPTDGYDTSEIDFPDSIEKVMQLPGIQLCRELVIGALSYDDYPTSWQDCIDKLAETGVPKALQRLEFTRGGYWDISSTELGNLSALYPHLARLQELRIEMGSMDFGTIELPALRTLDIYTGGLGADNVKAINEARWPALETLSLCIGETGNEYGCNVQYTDLEPLFTAENLPKVKHLALANSSLADQIAAGLVGSRILPRLETLDLSKGTFSDEGARAMLDNWQAFAHLKTIDLTHAYLSDEVIEELRAKQGPTIVLDDPQGDDEDRYCEISE